MAALAASLIAAPFQRAAATTIAYQATDLADLTPGEDLWRYAYSVAGFTLGSGFTIFFDYQLYSDLESPPPPVNADWDAITFQPDPNLPDDGGYDALALATAPSLADAFEVSVVWHGPGAPGSQPFVVYNALFQTIETGQTQLVPEPTTASLLLLGFLTLSVARRRKAPRLPADPEEGFRTTR